MKVNIWRIYAFLLSWTMLNQKCSSQKSFLTVYDDRCITNSSSAVTMIYDISDSTINNLENDKKDGLENGNKIKQICGDITECFQKSDKWFLYDSLVSSSADNLIKDRRWEDFPTFITEGTWVKRFTLPSTSYDISIPLSVQTNGPAFLYICDRGLTNCYCVFLQKLIFKLCHGLENFRNFVEYDLQDNIYEEGWNHFKININEDEISCEIKNEVYFLGTINDSKILPKFLFFLTRTTGLWKLHYFDYYMTTVANANLETKYPLSVSKERNCFAMFVIMCKSCWIEIKVVSNKSTMQETMPNKTVRTQRWKEIEFIFDMEEQESRHLQITPHWRPSKGLQPFWALGTSIRSCSKGEVRILKPAFPKVWTQKCQLIESGQIIGINKHKEISVLENCTENQFGEECLSCEKYFNDKPCPKKRRYCELVNKELNWKEKCYCSIGYKGDDCSELCENHTYGHGCQKSCTNCLDGCDRDTIFGKCNSDRCADNYMGTKCDLFLPKVRNVYYLLMTTSELLLTWSAPVEVNDQKSNYIIFFELKSRACKEKTNKRNLNASIPAFSDKNEYELRKNLEPYVDYYIEIRVNSSAGLGPPVSINLMTDAAEQIEQEEIPKFDFSALSSDNVMLNFVEVPCEKLRGPIYVNTVVTSEVNPWCYDTKTFNAQNLENLKLSIEGLKPFCKYNATLRFYRRDELIEKEISTNFETLQTAPNKISQLEVISKGKTHISLRWLPPYPPTGQLVEYKLTHCSSRYSTSCRKTWVPVTFEPSPCKLWPQYHCYKLIVKPKRENIYSIEVQAKNSGSKLYSNPVEKGPIYADGKKSDPPYGLNMMWTEDYHMNISWYHPNATNGVLSNFTIYVNEIKYIYTIDSEENYQLVYNMMIEEHITIPGDYSIRIVAFNNAGKSDETILKDTSPPPVPVHKEHIRNITCQNSSIAITFNDLTVYRKSFEQYMYVLITECSTCEQWITSYKNVLVKHHETNYLIKPIKSINVKHWKAIFTFDGSELNKFANRTLYIKNYTSNDVLYSIQSKPTNYSLAFVWIYKLERYVTINSTIIKDISCDKAMEGNTSSLNTEILVFITVLLLFTLVMMIVYIRWKKVIHKKVQELLRRIRPIRDAAPTVVHYENYQPNNEQVTLLPKINRNSVTTRIMPETICPGNPLFKTKNSLRVKLSDFRNYVKKACESDELSRQHELFPQGQTRPWTYGFLPENKKKNRYINLFAYNHSRVVLNKVRGDEYSDYINASYIDGYQVPRAYIATQGPKKNTILDFWRMVWQEKVTYIVMMANIFENGKKKVEQYWPNNEEKLILGDFTITFVSTEVHANFEYRKFQLQYGYAKARQVCQLHFKAWPDHGVPLYPQSLVPILQKMLTFRTADFPIVVHCSAGVGRTGTVILCDICLRMAASEGYVDVLAMLEHLRHQRANMVDNVEQYKLAHLVILNCLLGLETSVPINQNYTNNIVKYFQDGKMASQLKYIRSCEWEDDAMKRVNLLDDDEEMSLVTEKNRFPLIIPDNMARVFLHPYPLYDPIPSSTYINAVRVDAFCQLERFIVTQYPLPNTVGDFWRLVVEKNISVVVCLNDIPARDESCGLFFPVKLNKTSPVETIQIEHIKTKSFQAYAVLTFEIANYNSGQEINTTTIELVTFQGWNITKPVPNDHLDFATFVEDVTTIARNSAQTLITCYDGATASGLFIAMSFLLEQIKFEQACDVCQAVRSIRTSRKQFVNTEEQLKFLYKASCLYVEEKFNNYSNINI